MPRWQKIYWTGIGSNINGIHTKKEFLMIVRNQFPEMVLLRIKGTIPQPERIKKKDINRWMEFTGAVFIDL